MKRSPLRRRYARYFALASLSVLVAGGVLADTCYVVRAPLVIVGFPSILLLMALGSLSDVWIWPDSLSDGAWVIVFVLLMIPSVCFWAGVGWIVGHSIDKGRQDPTDTCSENRPSDDSGDA